MIERFHAAEDEEVIFETDVNNHFRVKIKDGVLTVASCNFAYGPIPINTTSPRPNVIEFQQVPPERSTIRSERVRKALRKVDGFILERQSHPPGWNDVEG